MLDLRDHAVTTVTRMGWIGTRNGALLTRAVSGGFEASVTVDRNLRFQQPIRRYRIAVFVLRATSNRWEDLHPLAAALLRALHEAQPGTVTSIALEQ